MGLHLNNSHFSIPGNQRRLKLMLTIHKISMFWDFTFRIATATLESEN
jgi:hypothetical protein